MSSSSRKVAVTGATGFVGRHAVAVLAQAGWQVRVLARSEPAHPLWQNTAVEVVLGSLSDHAALERLADGVDAVLHLAGAIKARDDDAFLKINRDGSAAMAQATARVAPKAHFLHVSSLAAREPTLSGYCASKRASEAAVMDALGPERVSVLRPPAVYGPGDRETLAFFKLAQSRWVPLLGPASARIALIHVADLVAGFTTQLDQAPSGRIEALADDHPQGYSWQEILSAAAAAVGNRRPRFVRVPKTLLGTIGRGASLAAQLTGQAAMFNAGKLRELLHEDWSVPQAMLAQSGAPRIGLAEGFGSTAAWYLREGWLR